MATATTPITGSKRQPKWEVGRLGKAFVALTVVETITLTAVAILALAEDYEKDKVRYLAVSSMVASFGWLYFALDSILRESVFQLFAALTAHTLILAYLVYHAVHGSTEEMGKTFQALSLALVAGVGVCHFVYVVAAKPICDTFGWRIFKKIGSNPDLHRAFQTRQVFLSLLRLDVYLSGLLLLLAYFYLLDAVEAIVNLCALGVTLLWAGLAWRSVMREQKQPMMVFWALSLVEPIYIVIKLVQLTGKANPGDYSQFYITGGLALLLRLSNVSISFFVVGNFKKGLLEKLYVVRKKAQERGLPYEVDQNGKYRAFDQRQDALAERQASDIGGPHSSEVKEMLKEYVEPLGCTVV